MNEERLGSLDAFARTLADHLARFADTGPSLPDPDDLRRLVEVGFFASLHEEEARRLEFNIAWQPVSSGCSEVVAITRPVAATPKNLAKLAPATQREATSIAVRREGDALVAWALLQRTAGAESPLTIRALAAGIIRVDYAGIPRALYARGESLLLGGANEIPTPARLLTQTFAAWAAGADPATGIDARAAVITRVAIRALEHGHGGMILVMPAEQPVPLGVRTHYPVADGANLLSERYTEVVRGVAIADRLERLRGSRIRAIDGRLYVRDEAQLAFAEAIEFVARLTAIDNAVLLDTDLRVRGFGVQVIEADAPHAEFTHRSPYEEEFHIDDLATFKGTRHPAGVIFCMRQTGEAAAIIASQDGRQSLVIKQARGAIEVIGSYEHGFGWR